MRNLDGTERASCLYYVSTMMEYWYFAPQALKPLTSLSIHQYYVCEKSVFPVNSFGSSEWCWSMWSDCFLITRMIVLYKTSFLLFILSGKTCICTSANPKMLPSLHIRTERTDRERSHGTNWNTHKHTTDVCYERRDNNCRREGWRTDRWNGNPEDLR